MTPAFSKTVLLDQIRQLLSNDTSVKPGSLTQSLNLEEMAT
jgi:hypothetical protein